MVINRLKEYFGEEPEERLPEEEFYIVAGEAGYFVVASDTAQRIARELARRRPPRWIVFRDLAGSEIRVRPSKLNVVCESTAEQRAYDRALNRALKAEDQQDRRLWEDE